VIDGILPTKAVAVEALCDTDAALLPEEEAVVSRAIEKRRREFATGRWCARRALETLGLPPGAVPRGAAGEPMWPPGVVGSITHCSGYRASAVAYATDLRSIGIDAEVHDALPDGILEAIARPEESGWLDALQNTVPSVRWDRLLFSAKEAVYKAWFPLTNVKFSFEDVVVFVDPAATSFVGRVVKPAPTNGVATTFEGRWAVCGDLLLTATAVQRDEE